MVSTSLKMVVSPEGAESKRGCSTVDVISHQCLECIHRQSLSIFFVGDFAQGRQ